MTIKNLALVASAIALTMSVGSVFAAETVRICTGSSSGIYAVVGKEIKSAVNGAMNIELVETQGTSDNMTRMLKLDPTDPNACDVIVGQPDGPTFLKRTEPALGNKINFIGVPLHREYLQVICNKESDVDDLGDLENDPTNYKIAVGKQGSGAWLVWQNIIAEDEDYGNIPTVALGGDAALDAVANGEATCMLESSALRSGTMTKADTAYGDYVKLVGANDSDFNDAIDIKGKPLYTYMEIPGDTYEASLQKGWGGAVDTISWNASMFINSDRPLSDNARSILSQAISRTAQNVRSNYGK